MALASLRHCAARTARRFGYRIERDVLGDELRIDVFDLIIRYVSLIKGERFFFVQIGANDGITVDPIRKYVLEYHWNGILVEPQPKIYKKLRENYRSEHQLFFENVAIAEHDGEMTLYHLDESIDIPAASGWASFDKKHVLRLMPHDVPVREMRVPAQTVSTLLTRHGVQSVDLLQVDTEGYDFKIIKMFLETGIIPSIIRFEYPLLSREELHDCFSSLASRDYRLHREGVDIIALRNLDWGARSSLGDCQ